MNRARNADYAARVCKKSVYSVVKITRLYDYQTWKTSLEKFSQDAQRFMGKFDIPMFSVTKS